MSLKKQLAVIKYLLALNSTAKCGSINTAAAKNGIKPSNLSRLISEFEDIIGGKLLNRTPKGVIPTALGTKVCALAEQIEHELEKADIQEDKDLQIIKIYVSSELEFNNFENFFADFNNAIIVLTPRRNQADIIISGQPPKEKSNFVEITLSGELRRKIWFQSKTEKELPLKIIDFIIAKLLPAHN